jgi:nucleoside-diphosphate-sugar epimerase
MVLGRILMEKQESWRSSSGHCFKGGIPSSMAMDTTSVVEILNQLSTIIGSSKEGQLEAPKEGEIRRSVLDIGRARKVLSWEPGLSLEEGLRETAAWFSAGNQA